MKAYLGTILAEALVSSRINCWIPDESCRGWATTIETQFLERMVHWVLFLVETLPSRALIINLFLETLTWRCQQIKELPSRSYRRIREYTVNPHLSSSRQSPRYMPAGSLMQPRWRAAENKLGEPMIHTRYALGSLPTGWKVVCPQAFWRKDRQAWDVRDGEDNELQERVGQHV